MTLGGEARGDYRIVPVNHRRGWYLTRQMDGAEIGQRPLWLGAVIGTEGLPASPLVPEVEADDLPDGDERARRRDLGVQFMRRLPTARVEIARRIGIEIDFEPSDMPDTEVARELLARIRDADLIDSLAEELARG